MKEIGFIIIGFLLFAVVFHSLSEVTNPCDFMSYFINNRCNPVFIFGAELLLFCLFN